MGTDLYETDSGLSDSGRGEQALLLLLNSRLTNLDNLLTKIRGLVRMIQDLRSG